MTAHLDDIQAALLTLARRDEGISNLEAGRLIESRDPLQRTEPQLGEDSIVRQVHKPGVIGIEARGRRRLRNMAAAGWLAWDDADQVWRVGGGPGVEQRHRRPSRTAKRLRPRPGGVSACA